MREEGQRRARSTPSDKQYGLAVGGPIIKDQAHFFFSYEGKEIDRPRDASAWARATRSTTCRPDLQALANETDRAPFEEDLYFGKIDWLTDDDHLLELTAKYRTEDELTEHRRRPEHRSLRHA